MRKGILFGLVLGALIYFFGPGLGLWEKDAPAAQPMTAAQTDKADAKTKEDGASDTKKGSEKTTASPVRTDKPAAQSASAPAAQTESLYAARRACGVHLACILADGSDGNRAGTLCSR